jgi:hypothetical protein
VFFVGLNQVLSPFTSKIGNILDMLTSFIIILTFLLPNSQQDPGFGVSLFIFIMNSIFLVVIVCFLFEHSIVTFFKEKKYKKIFCCRKKNENQYSSLVLDEDSKEDILDKEEQQEIIDSSEKIKELENLYKEQQRQLKEQALIYKEEKLMNEKKFKEQEIEMKRIFVLLEKN